jgi:hypothetical protein
MQIDQRIWTAEKGWTPKFRGKSDETVQLVFVFGPVSSLNEDTLFQTIRSYYPKAHIFGCSTAGEIHGTQVTDNSIVSTAVSFQFTRIKGEQVKLSESMDSFRAGEKLAKLLSEDGLAHIFVLSDGTNVNGSELVKGLSLNLPEGIGVTGGLAGDGEHFQDTMTFWDGLPEKNSITAVGFYGDRLKVGYGSLGGWDPFGPERIITRSNRNVLYELDGQSALELYKKYLGEHANGLPATGLLFPLSLRDKEGQSGVVRTILAINEKDQSMTFAGDMPQGAYARLMKANFDRLIDGAIGAAKTSYEAIGSFTPELAILISCVGRKMVLKQRTEEEVEGVREILGNSTVLAGFYSYGEICPFTPDTKCELHNQTMTITVLAEK